MNSELEGGRGLRQPALVNHAPTGHGPTGFDPARDFVNEFFLSHYPPDADRCEMEGCGNGWERRYQGGSTATIFPLMKLADGLELSVQGHFGAYSYPRGDFDGPYSQVEIMGPPGVPELADYERECNAVGERMIYPYVPVAVVNTMIAGRGGLFRDSRSKPDRAETGTGSVHESDGAGTAIARKEVP